MATWFPDGVNSGDAVTPIVPGGYAVVGKWLERKFMCIWDGKLCKSGKKLFLIVTYMYLLTLGLLPFGEASKVLQFMSVLV